MTQFIRYPNTGSGSGQGILKVATEGDLPLVGVTDGDVAITLDTDNLYAYHAPTTTWLLVATAQAAIETNAKTGCRASTTAALSATYNNGSGGVGATLISTVNAQFVSDGVTPSTNDRVLVKNQASALQNGIYRLTTQGSGATPWVLTRATDYDTTTKASIGSYTCISEGNLNAGKVFIQTSAAPVIGTNSISYITAPFIIGPTAPTDGLIAFFDANEIAEVTQFSYDKSAVSLQFAASVSVTNGARSATIGGGSQTNNAPNGFLGGGFANILLAPASNSFGVGGQSSGVTSGNFAGFIGGSGTSVSGDYALALGLQNGTVSGVHAVAIGNACTATAEYAFSRGRQAKATHAGAVVWSDRTASDFSSTAVDTWASRFAGGYALLGGGTFQMSASSVIADGSLSNNSLNPYISADILNFKWKDGSGNVYSHSLSSQDNFGVSFSVTQGSAQTIPNNSSTKITLDTGGFDHGGYFNTSNSRYTPLVQGVYSFVFQAAFVAPASAAIVAEFHIHKNGVAVATSKTNVPLGEFFSFSIPYVSEMNGVSDYVECFVLFTGNGGNSLQINNSPTVTYFQGYLVAEGAIIKTPVSVSGTSKTLAMSDSYTLQVCSNAANQTITVPPNSSVAFPLGSQIDFVQSGAGQVVIAAGVGVTIGSKFGNLKLAAQYSGASLLKTATDTWVLIGDLTA